MEEAGRRTDGSVKRCRSKGNNGRGRMVNHHIAVAIYCFFLCLFLFLDGIQPTLHLFRVCRCPTGPTLCQRRHDTSTREEQDEALLCSWRERNCRMTGGKASGQNKRLGFWAKRVVRQNGPPINTLAVLCQVPTSGRSTSPQSAFFGNERHATHALHHTRPLLNHPSINKENRPMWRWAVDRGYFSLCH